MKFRPLHDRVVVRRLDAEEKTAGGIIIPDSAKEKPMKARSSPSAPARATSRARSWHSTGTEVKLDGQELVIMKESDIMGIIEGAPAAKKKAA